MNMQMKMLLSTLALVLAAGGFTASHAQEQGTGGTAAESQPPQSPSQAPSAGAPEITPGGAGASSSTNDILNMKAGEIAGRQVYNAKGKELGKVDAVARDRTSGNLIAVISVGGFLGFGGSKVALPIEQLKLQDNKLTATTALSKKDLRNQASKYEEKRYEVVAEDATLSQVAPTAGASAAGGTPPYPSSSQQTQAPSSQAGAESFQSLDRNQDGYLSSEEVSNNPSIVSQWQELDKNGDNRLDQSEFSAFEAQNQAPSSGAVSFESLDRNKDGYLTSDEVGSNQSIISRWSELDTNRDNKLDQAEFSAFEQSEGARPSGDAMRDRPETGSPPSGQSSTGDMPPEQSAPSQTQ